MNISPVHPTMKQSLLARRHRTQEGLPWAPYIPWPTHELRKVHRTTTLDRTANIDPERVISVGENAGMSKKDRRNYLRRIG